MEPPAIPERFTDLLCNDYDSTPDQNVVIALLDEVEQDANEYACNNASSSTNAYSIKDWGAPGKQYWNASP